MAKTLETNGPGGADDPFTKRYIASLHALREDTDRALRYFDQILGTSLL